MKNKKTNCQCIANTILNEEVKHGYLIRFFKCTDCGKQMTYIYFGSVQLYPHLK